MKEGNLKPILPMEPKTTESIPSGLGWGAQIKWDGVRILVYYWDQQVQLFNRKLRPRSLHYPELMELSSYCMANSVILDGEVIALGPDGKPSFFNVMKRDGITRMDRVKHARQTMPITYMIFDVLYLNGKWLTDQPFREREKKLGEIIQPGPHVQLVSTHDDISSLFQATKEHQLEGIVIKRLESAYLVGKKSDAWLKLKNNQDVIAVIGGATLRAGVVNALLLGLYDNLGQLHYIGHVGTGKLTAQDWQNLTSLIQTIKADQRPFINKTARDKDAAWLKPRLTAKIQFSEWTPDRQLRHPSIQAFVDASPAECRFPN